MEHTVNQIQLRGTLQSLPEFSHENHGKRFMRFFLEVPRLSGTVDILPVICEEKTLMEISLTNGDTFFVSGQVRSHNIRTEGRRHLLIFVFAQAVLCDYGEPLNEVILEGPLCREPTSEQRNLFPFFL